MWKLIEKGKVIICEGVESLQPVT